MARDQTRNHCQLLRLAMWSGPRNISTAMMRAWGNRLDTIVLDEPFYAFYLKATGKEHPGAKEIIATSETDWRKVVDHILSKEIPTGKSILFQKQMTHHLLPMIGREWISKITNIFLIRDPRDVILSYIKKNAYPSLADLGFVQQCEIFDFVRHRTSVIPTVVDAADILREPHQMLQLLCHAIGVDFDPAMLSWPTGLRETDGIWAKHWYAEVAKSTSFRPSKPRGERIPDELRAIYHRCCESYEQLHRFRIRSS